MPTRLNEKRFGYVQIKIYVNCLTVGLILLVFKPKGNGGCDNGSKIDTANM